ncbi:hypothetical protein RQP46_007781 [Phenoliferia psychrophenolica]
MRVSTPLALFPLLALGVAAKPVVWEKRAAHTYPPADVKGPPPLQAWVDQYNIAKSKGLIPGFAPSTLVNGNPSYTGVSAATACSWTVSHCFQAYDVVDAPAGHVGVAFDDGPQLASPPLYQFLQAQGQAATHFMIGSRIMDNPGIFQQAIQTGGHIAIHTWSHPYMTTMTDMQVLGEIGWTAQIIFDNSGLVPAFWRPPYGDIDNRTFDWCLTEGGGTSCVGAGPGNDAGLDKELQAFYHGPKSPGLIILEHELTSRSVGGFMRNFATLKSQGWIPMSIPDLWSVPWYNSNVAVGGGPAPTNTTSNASPTNATAAGVSASAVKNGIPSSAFASRSYTTTVVIVTPTNTAQTVTAQTLTPSTNPTDATPAAQGAGAASSSSKPAAASREIGSWSVLVGGALVAGLMARL